MKKYGISLSENQLDFLLELSNVELMTTYYQWYLITADPDDNKFVDCAVAGQADYLVTHDKHFNILQEIEFPKVKTIHLDTMKSLLSSE